MNIWVLVFLLFIVLSIILYNFTIKKEDESNYPSLIVIFIIVCAIVFYSYFYRKDITMAYPSRYINSRQMLKKEDGIVSNPQDVIDFYKKAVDQNRKRQVKSHKKRFNEKIKLGTEINKTRKGNKKYQNS